MGVWASNSLALQGTTSVRLQGGSLEAGEEAPTTPYRRIRLVWEGWVEAEAEVIHTTFAIWAMRGAHMEQTASTEVRAVVEVDQLILDPGVVGDVEGMGSLSSGLLRTD